MISNDAVNNTVWPTTQCLPLDYVGPSACVLVRGPCYSVSAFLFLSHSVPLPSLHVMMAMSVFLFLCFCDCM